MVEISNAIEFYEWFGDRPRRVEVQIAWRIAMRVAPVLFKSCPPFDPSGNLELLPHLRALLTTAVLVDHLTDDVVKAGYSARLGKHRLGNAENMAAAASQCIADVISGASAFTNPNIKADDTRGMYFRAAFLSAEEVLGPDLWREVAADAVLVQKGESLFQARLWSGENKFSSDWQAVSEKWSLQTEQWKLWIDWYECALAGGQQNWDLLEEIVILPDEKGWGYKSVEFKPTQNGRGLLKGSDELKEKVGLSLEKMRNFEQKFHSDDTEYSTRLAILENKISNLEGSYADRMDAAEAAFREGQGIKEPVSLWKVKQEEHEAKGRASFRWFSGGLIIAGFLLCTILYWILFAPDFLVFALAPPGCDPVSRPNLCAGFSFRGFLIAGLVLTLLTLLLWWVRLNMKVYLSERHLGLDARERRAFAQAYVGLLAMGDASDEAKQQRAIVYASLFRPSTDGVVREDGGFDPSITAALSKVLAGR